MNNQSLIEADPEIFQTIQKESVRQKNGLEMIASENYASLAVMQAQGSIMTNKYAEGYPHKRYYGGCEFVDQAEILAIDRLKKLFNAPFANVQPHSGSQANQAVFLANLKLHDTILGLDLSNGGHLTHGSPVNSSGIFYRGATYKIDPESEAKPKLIIAGYSAYPRFLDFEKFKNIADDVGAELLVDMAHFAGLVATGHHPSPFPYADYVTSTTHKTLRGPRGGIILTQKEEKSKLVNSRIFPGIQGGPLMHVIAAKAVAFGEALRPDFKTYIGNVILNAKTLSEELLSQGFELVTGGTDNHLLLLDLSKTEVTGKLAETALDESGITVNKNTVPNEKRSPFVTSGIRIGTPALTTRGMGPNEMRQIGKWITKVLKNPEDLKVKAQVKAEVESLTQSFPLYT